MSEATDFDGRDNGLVRGVSSSDVQSKKSLPRGRAAVSVGPRYSLRAVGGIEQVLDPGRCFSLEAGSPLCFAVCRRHLHYHCIDHITRGKFFP